MSKMDVASNPRAALTVRETAQSLGISERMTWALVKDQQIASFRVGRLVRITPAAIQDYIARQSAGNN